MDRYCFGCGALLQTEEPTAIGYVTKNALSKEEVLCKRCFHIRNYNDSLDIKLNSDDFYKVLENISDSEALVVLIVDVFDFNGSMINGLNRFVQNDIIMLGNKFDLLPRSVKKGKVVNWMKKEAKEQGLVVQDACVVSAHSGFNLKGALAMIETYRNGRDVYIVGCTNVGKSTFINKLLTEFTDMEEGVLTTSNFPGTTLECVEIPLDESSAIIDTPGIINEEQMVHYVETKEYKKIIPKTIMRPTIYQIDKAQSIVMENVAIIDVVTDLKMSVVCYYSEQLNMHRTKYINKRNFMEKNADKFFIDDTHKNFKRNTFNVSDGDDIVISGLGWFKFTGEATINVHTYRGVGIIKRRSLV